MGAFDMEVRDGILPSVKRTERQLAAEQRFERLRDAGNPGYEELADGLNGGYGSGMEERYGRLIADKDLWTDALRLAFHEDKRVAFRASWALEWAYFHNRELFVPHLETFFGNYLRADNPSVHRHYTKMLCDMMRRGLFVPDDAQAEQIAEKTFDLLIGETTKVAVRVWSVEVLYELMPKIDWIGEHLAEVMRRQMETINTPAVLNHYGKLLRRMAGEK